METEIRRMPPRSQETPTETRPADPEAASGKPMRQVSLIRGLVLRKLKELKYLIQSLPLTEYEAQDRLSGDRGVRTAARIADYIMLELGHMPPAETDKQSPTFRAAKKAMDDGKR